MSEFSVDRGELREQPLSPEEKQVLSGYFQLEGQRQFQNYQTLVQFHTGGTPGLFDWVQAPREIVEELDEKRLTLELSQRDHWIDLIQSIHQSFFRDQPPPGEIQLWSLISLEKHTLVQVETGREEYRKFLDFFQQRQLPLIQQLGEISVQSINDDIQLFYDLLDLEGLDRTLFLA